MKLVTKSIDNLPNIQHTKNYRILDRVGLDICITFTVPPYCERGWQRKRSGTQSVNVARATRDLKSSLEDSDGQKRLFYQEFYKLNWDYQEHAGNIREYSFLGNIYCAGKTDFKRLCYVLMHRDMKCNFVNYLCLISEC